MSQEETVYLETLKAKMDSKLNQFFGPLTEQLSVGSLQMLGRKGDNLVSDARFIKMGESLGMNVFESQNLANILAELSNGSKGQNEANLIKMGECNKMNVSKGQILDNILARLSNESKGSKAQIQADGCPKLVSIEDPKIFDFFKDLSYFDELPRDISSKFIPLKNTSQTKESPPFNDHCLMPAIYVRECYPKLFETILQIFKVKEERFDQINNVVVKIPIEGIILAGSSGVGKSVFGYYFIRRLIELKKSFIYSPSNTSSNYYFFNNTFYQVEGSISMMSPDYYIVDGREMIETPIFANSNTKTLLISPANKKYFKEYQKNINVRKIYMPYWIWPEIEEFIDKQDLIFKREGESRFDKQKSRNIFDVYGGIARYVLDKSLLHSSDELQEQLIQRIRLASLIDLVDESKIETSETTALILHYEIDSETFKFDDIVYASNFILHQITQVERPARLGLISE